MIRNGLRFSINNIINSCLQPTILFPDQELELYDFINRRIINKQIDPQEIKKHIAHNILKCAAILLGSAVGIPNFDIGFNNAGKNQAVKWISGSLVAGTFSITSLWSLLLLTQQFKVRSIEEKNILQTSSKSIPVHIISHVVGLLGGIPGAFVAYKYNKYKWLASISFVADYALATNGSFELIDQIIKKYK
ncbi:MAG: hypothetical protein EOO85_23795, partial [Pedobacter sp.]